MIELALCWESGTPVSAREVAHRQSVPQRFLEQQVNVLRQAGLIVCQRGPAGGCRLARAPEEIDLKAVIEALEGELVGFDCLDGSGQTCDSRGHCAVQDVWEGCREVLRAHLSSQTLAELAEKHRGLGASRPEEFCI